MNINANGTDWCRWFDVPQFHLFPRAVCLNSSRVVLGAAYESVCLTSGWVYDRWLTWWQTEHDGRHGVWRLAMRVLSKSSPVIMCWRSSTFRQYFIQKQCEYKEGLGNKPRAPISLLLTGYNVYSTNRVFRIYLEMLKNRARRIMLALR